MSQKVIFTVGLPGSGKSTWAKAYCEKNKDWVRVNRDDLRNMRGKYWLPKQEDLITEWEFQTIKSALEMGYNVIVDATNLNEEFLKKLKEGIPSNVSISTKSFLDVSLEKCIENDLKRPNSVGHKVIKRMYDKYIVPTSRKYKPDATKPPAIIFDIDGTLSLMGGRSPFDWDKVGEDKLNEPVYDALCGYHTNGYKIITLSGRDGICEKETLDWLDRYDIPITEHFQRAEGDNRKDSIIKEEIFRNSIADRYNVIAVYDDRLSVCRMWHKLGLSLFRVGDPDADF